MVLSTNTSSGTFGSAATSSSQPIFLSFEVSRKLRSVDGPRAVDVVSRLVPPTMLCVTDDFTGTWLELLLQTAQTSDKWTQVDRGLDSLVAKTTPMIDT